MAAERAEDKAEIAELKAQNAEIMGMMRRMEGLLVAQGGRGGGQGQQAGEIAIQVPGNENQVAIDNRSQQININVFGKEAWTT